MVLFHPSCSPSLTSCIEKSSTVNSTLLRFFFGAPQPSRVVDVPHVRQAFNWDCGLACVLMVLKAVGICHLDLPELRKFCSTTSIWTVDLAHLLRQFGLDVVFLTITLGANPEFASESFYMENMPEDEQRVQRLFLEAPSAGIHIYEKSLDCVDVKQLMLSGKYLIIALVDKRKLLGPKGAAADVLNRQAYTQTVGYTGHYIVICGYDTYSDMFTIRDPASLGERTVLSCKALEEARRAFGTDEDLLLVSMHGRNLATPKRPIVSSNLHGRYCAMPTALTQLPLAVQN